MFYELHRSSKSEVHFGRHYAMVVTTCVYIFQALIHTPLLRDYFFAERHECTQKMSTKCLVCEMSRVFQVNEDLLITICPPVANKTN